jgi:predicted lipoprotein
MKTLFFFMAMVCVVSCSKKEATSSKHGGAHAITKAALLQSLSTCAYAQYDAFKTKAQNLENALRAYVASPSDAALLTQSQQAWKDAMLEWQKTQVFRFGPMANSMDPGGQDISQQVYAWPYTNRCLVEEQLVKKTDESPDFARSLVSARGLDAIEYALFYTGTDNACSPSLSVINTQGTWNTLVNSGQLQARKAAYAWACAKSVLSYVESLQNTWNQTFRTQFLTAGEGSRLFDSDHAALNAASDALFYLDYDIKDLKLAKPMGKMNCTQPLCLDAVESPYAHFSLSNIQSNMASWTVLMKGCGNNTVGFDAWLRAIGQGGVDLANQMDASRLKVVSSLNTLSLPLEDVLRGSPSGLDVLYNDLKAVSDDLKTQFITLLNLDLPRVVETDND